MSPLRKRAADSPARSGTAELVTDNSSFAGADAWIYVRDPGKGAGPIRLGGSYASDGPAKLQQALWSRDGSVLAVQARVGEASGKHFKGTPQTLYVAAYDYKEHEALRTAKPTSAFSRQVGKLLQERGGKGRAIFTLPYDASGRPMSAREAKQYPR